MRVRWIAMAAALAAVPASASLPPNSQRLRELHAVLANAAVLRAFGTNEPIDRVEYVRRDLFRVTSGRCHMDVAIVGLPSGGRRGARQFQVQPGEKVCAGGGRR